MEWVSIVGKIESILQQMSVACEYRPLEQAWPFEQSYKLVMDNTRHSLAQSAWLHLQREENIKMFIIEKSILPPTNL